MITPKDIKKIGEHLLEVFEHRFATKDDLEHFTTKYDLESLEAKTATINSKVDKLQTTMDNLASNNKKFDSLLTVQQYRTEQLENWAKTAGKKIVVQFKK